MNLYKKFRVYWVLLLFASFILLIGCQVPEIASKWRDKDIIIDASDDEWQGAMQYYDEKTDTGIGVSNDDTDLYLCLTTSDLEIQTDVVSKGFMVWFNGKGSKAKELGIRFPVIEQTGPGGRGGAPPGGEGGRGGQGGPGGGPAGASASLEELKILTSKKDEGTTCKVSEAAQMGVAAWMTIRDNRFVYELKIPLHKTDSTPYAVMPSATNYVGVGFMVYGTTSSSTSGISGFGGSTGGISSGGGMGGGGMGGGRGGGGGFDMSSDRGFSIRDASGMTNIFEFFSTGDNDVFDTNHDDVFVINAQGGGPPPGGGMGGGGMGGGDMGGGDMGGGDMGGGMPSQPQSFEVWTKIKLASNPGGME
jgi:hypothetical protein